MRRSTDISTVRGISPVGTASGASCSFHDCWSTYEHLAGRIWYVSRPHGGSFGWRTLSHTRGRFAPAKPARTCSDLVLPHVWHCAKTEVAFAFTFEAEMLYLSYHDTLQFT